MDWMGQDGSLGEVKYKAPMVPKKNDKQNLILSEHHLFLDPFL